jgi:hypothetical protein
VSDLDVSTLDGAGMLVLLIVAAVAWLVLAVTVYVSRIRQRAARHARAMRILDAIRDRGRR